MAGLTLRYAEGMRVISRLRLCVKREVGGVAITALSSQFYCINYDTPMSVFVSAEDHFSWLIRYWKYICCYIAILAFDELWRPNH